MGLFPIWHHCNPPLQTMCLQCRLRKLWLEGGQLATIGPDLDLTYPHEHLGEGAPALAELLKTGSGWGKKLKEAKNPVIIVGPGILHRQDRGSILQKVRAAHGTFGKARSHSALRCSAHLTPYCLYCCQVSIHPTVCLEKIQVPAHHATVHCPCVKRRLWKQVHEVVEKTGVVRDDWNGYNVMHDSASRVAALDLGFLPSARSASAPPPKFVYLLGSDDFAEEDVPADAFVVYQVGSLRITLFFLLLL